MPIDLERSSAPLTEDDLRRLTIFIGRAHEDLCVIRPDLAGRLVTGVLAQGGSAHLLDPTVGLKDVDLWLFYDTTGLRLPAPARRRKEYDYGPSAHGRRPADPPKFTGRRIDLMCRSLPPGAGSDPVLAVQTWLNSANNSPQHLRLKPVVILWPAAQRGVVAWNPTE